MPANRYFSPTPLREGISIAFTGQEQQHLVRVMRHKVGDVVELIDGKGASARATVSAIGRHEVQLQIDGVEQHEPPKRRIILALALLQPHHLDIAVEKCVELGISELWLFPADGCERRQLSPNGWARLEHLAIAATKQCGRFFLPPIVWREKLEECLPSDALLLYGALDTRTPIPPLGSAPVVICIGPERGFTPRELALLAARATPISLNPNILRAETAAIAATALLAQ